MAFLFSFHACFFFHLFCYRLPMGTGTSPEVRSSKDVKSQPSRRRFDMTATLSSGTILQGKSLKLTKPRNSLCPFWDG